MSKPVKVTLQPVVRGDTWRGISAISIKINGVAPSANLSSVRMQFRATPDAQGAAAEELTSPSEIVIDDADAWEFHVPAKALALSVGKWFFDVETTDATGAVRTYINGTLQVLQDVSR